MASNSGMGVWPIELAFNISQTVWSQSFWPCLLPTLVRLDVSNSVTTISLVPLPTWFHSFRLCELKRMCLQILFQSGKSASRVLSSPGNQIFGIRAEVAELLCIAERFNEHIRLKR